MGKRYLNTKGTMVMEKILADLYRMKNYVDDSLSQYIADDEPFLKGLVESINYSLFSGGKRIRPIFCFISGELFDVPMENLKSLSCAVEMIHTASLIMDDLPHMDNAAVRRGKPANHTLYGQDVASLASIGLLTKAYEIVLADKSLKPEKKVQVVEKLANTVGIDGLSGGQFVDLKFANESLDTTAVEFIHKRKTASLFVASGVTAAYIGNANSNQMIALEEYAENMGFAYQILDDLLNVEGNEKEIGKTLHDDENNFVILHGVEQSKIIIQEYSEKALDAVNIFKGKNEKLVTLCQVLLKQKS